MKVINKFYKGKSLVSAHGVIKFDENGVAEVQPDEFAEELAKMKGFSLEGDSDEKTDVVEPAKSVEKEPETETTPDEVEKPEEEPADNAEGDLKEELAKMNVPQLKKYAKDNDIDLGDASKKDEILKVILG